MNPIRVLTGIMGWTGVVIFAIVASLIAWFVPWVFSFYLGLIVYFPYEPDGLTRYSRFNGPLAGWVSERWIPGDEIPPSCKTALVASEDSRFYEHHGIDLESLQKSYNYNQRRHKIRRGGSTITQQLVKNAFLSRDRSYIRKAREVTGAVLLDAIMSKDLQLTWYLNLVEYAPNVYGIGEAARFYFERPAQELTPSQCITLVSVLPGPTKWGSSLRRRSLSTFMQSRYRTILSRMILMGMTPNRDISYARSTSPFGKRPLPKRAMPVVREAAQDGANAALQFEDASDDEVAKSTERGEEPSFEVQTYSDEPAQGLPTEEGATELPQSPFDSQSPSEPSAPDSSNPESINPAPTPQPETESTPAPDSVESTPTL